MSFDPIIINTEDLSSKKVEKRLAEQAALARNREQAALASRGDTSKLKTEQAARTSLLDRAWFLLCLAGLLGGLLGWALSQGAYRLGPVDRKSAADLMKAAAEIARSVEEKRLSPIRAQMAIAEIRQSGANNPYLTIYFDDSLTPELREQRYAELERRDSKRLLIIKAFAGGLCAMAFALCITAAEPLRDRNYARAMTLGALASAIALILGGAGVFLFERSQNYFTLLTADPSAGQSAAWAILGLITGLVPGVVMKQPKRIVCGLLGGIIGGIAANSLAEAIHPHTSEYVPTRAVVLATLGAVTGLCVGLIPTALKSGWLKVTVGLIAGKQFVVYRNPTYIGSGPECQIYLFKDAKVGRRHAAIHIVATGFEIEDLPLGEATQVNGEPVTRQRLHHGDKIKVGSSELLFREKVR